LKNAMQLKGIIENMAAKTGIKANALLQNYMLEDCLSEFLLLNINGAPSPSSQTINILLLI